MQHENFDDALMNSAYLSEAWAVRDLYRFKHQYPAYWSEERERQLKDEMRHARMCGEAIQKTSSVCVHDLKAAMQEILYRPHISLEETRDPISFAAVQSIMERRAVWIYRTYLRVGTNEFYKKVFRKILADEEMHREIDLDMSYKQSRMYQDLIAVDRKIFRQDLPNKFGRLLLKSSDFWNLYYSNCKWKSSKEAPLLEL